MDKTDIAVFGTVTVLAFAAAFDATASPALYISLVVFGVAVYEGYTSGALGAAIQSIGRSSP